MKGRINRKRFMVFDKNDIDNVVTIIVKEYFSKGYKIRPNLNTVCGHFCIDLARDGEEEIVRIEAEERMTKILAKDFEPPKEMIRLHRRPITRAPCHTGMDSCCKVVISVTKYPHVPTREEVIRREGGSCIDKTVFYMIPNQNAFVMNKDIIAEILAERIRRS